ncbi:MAG: hypothetical protein RR250_04590 [Akkermansia sp.]
MKLIPLIAICAIIAPSMSCWATTLPAELTRQPSAEELAPSQTPHLPQVTEAEMAQHLNLVAPFAGIPAAQQEAQQAMATDQARSAKLDQNIHAFCHEQGIELQDYNIRAQVANPPAPFELPKPSATSATPSTTNKDKSPKKDKLSAILGDEIIITCEGGCYFDSEAGILVYIKDIKLRGKDVSLDCDNEVKVYLVPEPAKDKGKDKKEDNKVNVTEKTEDAKAKIGSNLNMKFKDVKMITADGNVIANGKNEKGQRFQAKAQHITVNPLTQEMLMTGGYPSLKDEKNEVQCVDSDGYIRMTKDGKVYIHGKTQTRLTKLEVKNQKDKK